MVEAAPNNVWCARKKFETIAKSKSNQQIEIRIHFFTKTELFYSFEFFNILHRQYYDNVPTKSAYELTHEASKVLPQDRYVLSIPYYIYLNS